MPGACQTINPISGTTVKGTSFSAAAHVSIAGIATGTYNCTIVVNCAEETEGSPRKFNVSLEVKDLPTVPLAVDATTDQNVYLPGQTMRIVVTVKQGEPPIINAVVEARCAG